MQVSRLRDFEVWYENGEEFHRIKRDVFGEHSYAVEFATATPYIIDVGAHVGLSVLYFKMLYPRAIILAIEPQESIVKILEKNIAVNRLMDVRVIQAAVGSEERERDLHVDMSGEGWFSTGSIYPRAWNNQQKTEAIRVPQKKLSDLIDREVDLLKLDIEGAEEEVLLELGDKMKRIKKILFEFHPVFGRTPEKIERVLKKHGFGVRFWQGGHEIDWRKTRGLLLGEAER